jgi:hypothetical protein
MSNGSEHMNEEPAESEAPASRLLGMHEDLPALHVADDVRYVDADGNDVTDEVIANNMDAVRVRDLTEE